MHVLVVDFHEKLAARIYVSYCTDNLDGGMENFEIVQSTDNVTSG